MALGPVFFKTLSTMSVTLPLFVHSLLFESLFKLIRFYGSNISCRILEYSIITTMFTSYYIYRHCRHFSLFLQP